MGTCTCITWKYGLKPTEINKSILLNYKHKWITCTCTCMYEQAAESFYFSETPNCVWKSNFTTKQGLILIDNLNPTASCSIALASKKNVTTVSLKLFNQNLKHVVIVVVAWSCINNNRMDSTRKIQTIKSWSNWKIGAKNVNCFKSNSPPEFQSIHRQLYHITTFTIVHNYTNHHKIIWLLIITHYYRLNKILRTQI